MIVLEGNVTAPPVHRVNTTGRYFAAPRHIRRRASAARGAVQRRRASLQQTAETSSSAVSGAAAATSSEGERSKLFGSPELVTATHGASHAARSAHGSPNTERSARDDDTRAEGGRGGGGKGGNRSNTGTLGGDHEWRVKADVDPRGTDRHEWELKYGPIYSRKELDADVTCPWIRAGSRCDRERDSAPGQ